MNNLVSFPVFHCNSLRLAQEWLMRDLESLDSHMPINASVAACVAVEGDLARFRAIVAELCAPWFE